MNLFQMTSKILCKLTHDKLVYQNKFHNFWSYTVTYKNYGNYIYQLTEQFSSHSKSIVNQYFIFFLNNIHHIEVTQKFS